MSAPRRAMTLMELLVALALLGILASLTSLMWTQLRAWGDDTSLAQAALRPHRVYTTLEEQWKTRAHAGDDQTFGRVLGEPAELSFVTHRALRRPDWPIVEATYRIEPASPNRPARLVYEEVPLGPNFDTTRMTDAGDPLVLIDNIADASLRYRVVVQLEHNGETYYEERWVDTVESTINEGIELRYVEFIASAKGETVRWVGVAEPSR